MYLLDVLGPKLEPESYSGLRVILGGASGETKPTDCLAGSFFLEDDTGKKYTFDGDDTWTELG